MTDRVVAIGYKITTLPNGMIELRLGGDPMPANHGAIVLRFALAEALSLGLDLAMQARMAAERLPAGSAS